MTRFQLTAESFAGTAEVWYNFEGMLCRIDLFDCTMNYEQIQYICKNISPVADQFTGLIPASVRVKEVPFELTLQDFKREYPYSRNYHLLDAMWTRYSKKQQVLIYFRAIDYRRYCERNKWYNPMIAATWLRKEEYKNDWKKM